MQTLQAYKTVGKQAQDEFIERKSRFIGAITPITTEEEALAFIDEKKTEHWQATHNCWAYIVRDTGVMRYSDDGEPQGTAGIPILEILKKEEIFDACVVVTRYYGGIQLGAGGLVRAYSQGAKVALDAGGRVTMAPCKILTMTLPYPLYDRALSAFEDFTLTVQETEFTEDVAITLELLAEEQERFSAMITELTAGEVTPKEIDSVFAPLDLE